MGRILVKTGKGEAVIVSHRALNSRGSTTGGRCRKSQACDM